MNILHISPYFPSLGANHAGGVCMGKQIETLRQWNTVYVPVSYTHLMQYCAVYINQGLNAHREAFSPAIIIEELLLQRFLHTLK